MNEEYETSYETELALVTVDGLPVTLPFEFVGVTVDVREVTLTIIDEELGMTVTV